MTIQEFNQKIFRECLEDFLTEFVDKPYLCYTEHGQHARFYSQLHDKLPQKYASRNLDGHEIETCLIQKEYPTATDLDKPRRQNWDISLLKSSLTIVPIVKSTELGESKKKERPPFDYFELGAVAEFGLNERLGHLIDDYLRVSHPGAYVDNRYVVQLYRLSEAGKQISGRDWSQNARDIKNCRETKNKKDRSVNESQPLPRLDSILDNLINLNLLSKGNIQDQSDQRIREYLSEIVEIKGKFNDIEKTTILKMLEDAENRSRENPRRIFHPVTFYFASVDVTDEARPLKEIVKIQDGRTFIADYERSLTWKRSP